MGRNFDKLRQVLDRGRAGRRFQDRYEAARAARKDARWTRRVLRVFRLLLAVAAIVVGLFLTVLPGPAILFFFIAGGLLASESLRLARGLDWSEVKLRAGWAWVQQLSWTGKAALIGLVAAFSAGLAGVSYHLLTQ